MNKYLKFECWNTCDLGNIHYQDGQHFIFYLDADVGEPIHEEVEEGQENGDGDFIPTYRRQMKRYRIRTGLIPDYLIDAIQRMKLHDNIELTFKSGEVEQIYNVDVEPEWQFEKYAWQGTMTLTFDMDESITVGACCDNLVVQTGGGEPEPEPIPDLYWVAETGSDVSGDGTYANPWATLAYAATQATTPGDVIHVKAGTITETVQTNLAVNVSIVGQGDTSIIKAGAALNPIIELYSTSEGTDGNQSISYLTLDGNNLTGTRAIYNYLRKNVIVHHVTVKDFSAQGIHFRGSIIADSPVIYATGNKIYNCTLTNTCGRGGAITVRAQDGILINDNIITGYQRALGHDPTLISMNVNRDVRFYNNTLNMDRLYFAANGTTALWGFHIESWDCNGGYQFYNNTFNGGHVPIDVGGTYNVKGTFDYCWDIHHNTWQWSAQYPTQVDGSFGLVYEGGVKDLRIRNNHFKNVPQAINSSIVQESRIHEDIHIYYNIMENMGWGDSAWNFGISIGQGAVDAITRRVYVYNNVISGGTSGAIRAGVFINSTNEIYDIFIRNNIIQNVVSYGCITFWDSAGTIEDITIQNNILYNNVNGNDFYYHNGKVVTNLVNSDDIEGDPLFVSASDFHLQAGSPGLNAGLNLGLTSDFEGNAVDATPDIGAYEN